MLITLVGLLVLCMCLVLSNHGAHNYISKINKSSVFLNQPMLVKQNPTQIMQVVQYIYRCYRYIAFLV
jgi:hypothetical protein